MNLRKEDEVYNNSDLEERILDIRRRIEEQRRELCTSRPEPVKRHEEVVEAPRVVETSREEQEKERRNAELNDIKLKLLGKKK